MEKKCNKLLVSDINKTEFKLPLQYFYDDLFVHKVLPPKSLAILCESIVNGVHVMQDPIADKYYYIYTMAVIFDCKHESNLIRTYAGNMCDRDVACTDSYPWHMILASTPINQWDVNLLDILSSAHIMQPKLATVDELKQIIKMCDMKIKLSQSKPLLCKEIMLCIPTLTIPQLCSVMDLLDIKYKKGSRKLCLITRLVAAID